MIFCCCSCSDENARQKSRLLSVLHSGFSFYENRMPPAPSSVPLRPPAKIMTGVFLALYGVGLPVCVMTMTFWADERAPSSRVLVGARSWKGSSSSTGSDRAAVVGPAAIEPRRERTADGFESRSGDGDQGDGQEGEMSNGNSGERVNGPVRWVEFP